MTEKRTNQGAFTGTYSDKEHYKRALWTDGEYPYTPVTLSWLLQYLLLEASLE